MIRDSIRTLTCAVGASGALFLAASPAHADVVPGGMKHVPLELTVEGQQAFEGTTFVVFGCSADSRHTLTIAKPSQPVTCKTIKTAPVVYAVPTKDLKPIEELIAKDVGWGMEQTEMQKLLEKVPLCGSISEQTLVEESKGLTSLSARYAVEKSANGCSVKKLAPGETAPSATASPSGATTPAKASNPAAPAPAAGSAPVAKSGCATAAGGATATSHAALVLLAACAALLRRRQNALSAGHSP